MLALLSSLSIVVQAADDEPLFKDVKISGVYDIYYQHSFGKPSVGTPLIYRQLDVRHSSFATNSLLFNVEKAPTDSTPLGFFAQFAVGEGTDIIHAAEPGGQDRYKLLQQGYVSYAPAGQGLRVDLGKFFSWIGYESAVPSANDLYGIGFQFFFAQPTYHVGLRATKNLGKGLSASAYLVNGWNEVEDSNPNKSYGATLNVPLGATNAILNYYGGVEGSSGVNGYFGTAGGGRTAVNLGEAIVTHQLTPSVKLAFSADYASNEGVNGGPSGNFAAYSGLARMQFRENFVGTVRYELVTDPDGLRSGVNGRFASVTAGIDYTYTKGGSLRLEFRADSSNRAVFESDSGAEKTRTTVLLAHIVKF
jgi:hypothetical protein